MNTAIQMPRYQSHKKVWALKIKETHQLENEYALHFEHQSYAPRIVERAWFSRHEPKAGGYFVVYDDGYESYSPAEAFEGGYTLIS